MSEMRVRSPRGRVHEPGLARSARLTPRGDTVPLNRPAEPLAPGPRGATQARRWVSGVCEEIGRSDLVENAALAMSEVVTNAILHGRPPVTVRLRGTRDHPRVEVRDESPDPPAPTQDDIELEFQLEVAT